MEWVKHVSWVDVFFGWEPASVPEAELQAAIDAARGADVAWVFTGFDMHTEREAADRSYELPPVLQQLIVGVAEANPNTAVVLHAGGGAGIASWIGRVKALLHVWYPGQEGGRAVAEILFGMINPSGKLPVSIERCWEDNSACGCYHDTDRDGRVFLSDGVFSGYRHLDAKGIAPLFPFGYGLSYTSFAYANLALSRHTLTIGESLEVALDICNTGARDGAEVVQVYVSPETAHVPRPPRELKGFAKVFLAAGEIRRVRITLGPDAFAYYDLSRDDWHVEPGVFTIQVGASSRDLRVSERVSVVSEGG